MPYYIVENGQRVGPLSDNDFQNRVLMGSITPETYVWQPGMANWVRYGELQPPMAVPAAPVVLTGDMGYCNECFTAFPQSEMVTISGATVCAGCKPLLLQRVREGGGPITALKYAGFWVRFGAKFLDGLIQNCVLYPLSWVLFGGNMSMFGGPKEFQTAGAAMFVLYIVLSILLPMCYTIFFLGKFGATPGKMALGIKVVRSDGSNITYMRAMGRYFSEIISGMILGIGYIMAAFDSEKRALHDHICDTRVVFK